MQRKENMRSSLKSGKGIPIRDENKHANEPASKKKIDLRINARFL
ncbi:MAG: hypothetical protein ACTSYC_06480 [Promethearchaeota archaeon]